MILMVVGAGGFIAALVLYQSQLLCMFSSTLVVFLGLFWNLRIRKAAAEQQIEEGGVPQPGGAAVYREIQPPPVHSMMREFIPVQQEILERGTLPARLIQILQERNIWFAVEAEREGRSILRALSAEGVSYTILIVEEEQPADVSDLRSLAAMRAELQTDRALMISGSSFTQQAISWSAQHDIDLLDADQLDLLEL